MSIYQLQKLISQNLENILYRKNLFRKTYIFEALNCKNKLSQKCFSQSISSSKVVMTS